MLMKIENTTAVAYFNNQGGTVSKELISLTQAGTYGCGAWGGIFTFKLSTYLPGVMNQAVEVHEGHIKLEPRPLNLPKKQQTLWVTGSASRLTNQCRYYFSWRPDPFAEATDAFLQDWTTIKGFANPPWNLIPRVLLKTQTQGVNVILVAPVWKTQPWYPLLLSLVVDWPCLLPKQTPNIESVPIMPQLAVWRESLISSQGLSGQATELILNSWRS